MRAIVRTLERLPFSAKAVILLVTFGITLGLVIYSAWDTSRRVAGTIRYASETTWPAEERVRDLAILFHDVCDTYEHAVLLGEQALITHNRDAGDRFLTAARDLGAFAGQERSSDELATSFRRYQTAASNLASAMLETPDVLQDAEGLTALSEANREAREHLEVMLRRELDRHERASVAALAEIDSAVAALSERVLKLTIPAVILWILAFAYVRVRVVAPLVRLSRATHRVAGGDLQAGIQDIPAPDDEIGELAGGFRAMSEGLLDSTVSKEFLGKVLDAIPDAVIVVDRQRRIRRVNRGALQLLGQTEEALVGNPLGRLGEDIDAAGHPDWRPRGATVDATELPKAVAADGTRIPVAVAASPLASGSQCDGRVLVLRDQRPELAAVAERRELEQRLHQAAKLESVGQLAAGIAHEINTPIQYVGDNTRFLQDAFRDLLVPLRLCCERPAEDGCAPAPPAVRASLDAANADYLMEEIPRAIDQTLEGVGRVATIVRAMKEFSHPGAESASVDLNRAIQTTVTVARNEWKYVADVELHLDPALQSIQARPGEINQVILNIVVNAAHAIAAKVREGEKGTIRITTRNTASGVEVAVADTGTGIPEAIRDRIFDPFFTTKGVGKGTGQGLAIAHSVVCRRHGGTLEVESREGEGSTFRIRLPRAETTAADREVPAV